MKLSITVDQYVARKRIDGYAFSNQESRLARFCKSSGDLDISDLSSDHVVAYLDGSDAAIVTWRQKYFLLLRFFKFLHRRSPNRIDPRCRSSDGRSDRRGLPCPWS